MKKPEWITGNHMKFESQHKTFNRKVDSISTGNVIGKVQLSLYIRAHSETECNGFTNPPGHLQDFDLKPFVGKLPDWVIWETKRVTKTRKAILYVFFHWQGEKRIVHGAVLTDSDYDHPKVIQRFYLGHSSKSNSVIDEAIKYIAEE